MAQIIKPWIAALVEAEVDNVIAWRTLVKQEPDADEHPASTRYKDNGSNLQIKVGVPPLDADSRVQLLEKPGLDARAKISVSDGDAALLITLSDAAWNAYDAGMEEDGDEPRRGDLLLCKQITIFTTTDGPREELIKFRIEDLEIVGNMRKPLGNPTPVLSRAPIVALLKKVENLRAKLNPPIEDDEMAIDAEDGEEAIAIKQEYVEENDEAVGSQPIANFPPGSVPVVRPRMEASPIQAAPGAQSHTPRRRSPPLAPMTSVDAQIGTQPYATAIQTQQPQTQSAPVVQASPQVRTSPVTSAKSGDVQMETQLPAQPTQPVKSRPVRRNRGGGYAGGVEAARGDNLTGPQAPTLQHRQYQLPADQTGPQENPLLGLMLKQPGQAPRHRTPQPSAPVSAQVVTEEVVAETPAKPLSKGKRTLDESKAQDSTPVPRRRHRIPRDQRKLLDHPSSWNPPDPSQQCPPDLLALWDAEALLASRKSSQPSPVLRAGESSEAQSVEEVHPASQTSPPETSPGNHEDESDETSLPENEDEDEDEDEDDDEDELLEWSQTQPSPKKRELPPDSSAASVQDRTRRPEKANSGSSAASKETNTPVAPMNTPTGPKNAFAGIPTGPRADRSPHSALPVRRPSTPSQRRGDFYRPGSSGRTSDVPQSTNGTERSEMEAGVPRPLYQPHEYRRDRSEYYRGEQRRYW